MNKSVTFRLQPLCEIFERQLKALLAETLEERRQRLQSIAGVGPLISIALAQRSPPCRSCW
ncbi:MAG: hypothetical protein ACHBMF_11705 [Chromatiales bacterium]